MSRPQIELFSKIASNLILFSIIVAFIVGALRRKVNVYETFIEGAKGGIQTSLTIIPYLVGMLVAIGALRNSGVMGFIVQGFNWIFTTLGVNTDFTPALPTALMKPLSGSGSQRGDDRRHEDLRRGLVRRPAGLRVPGLGRHHVLHRRAVLRFGRHPQDALRDLDGPAGRPVRRDRGGVRRLPVLPLRRR
jgi:hypothetical protein